MRARSPRERIAGRPECRIRPSRATGLGKPLKLLARPVQDPLPIYLGAIGPKAVDQAGAIADGWLPFMLDPSEPDVLLEPLREGARRRAARSTTSTSPPSCRSAVGEDLGAARDAVRPWLAFYLGAMGAKDKNFYVELAERDGPRRGRARGAGPRAGRRPDGRRRRR